MPCYDALPRQTRPPEQFAHGAALYVPAPLLHVSYIGATTQCYAQMLTQNLLTKLARLRQADKPAASSWVWQVSHV